MKTRNLFVMLTAVLLISAASHVAQAQCTSTWVSTSTTLYAPGGCAKVGVSTTSPGAKLDVGVGATARGGYTSLLVGGGTDTTHSQLELYSTSASGAIIYDGAKLHFFTNGSSWIDGMDIDNAGNVSVGASTPLNKLHVYSTTSADGLSIDGTNNPALVLRSSGVVTGYGPAIVTQAASYFSDSQVGDTAFRNESHNIILGGHGSSGGASTVVVTGTAVGIRTASPSYTLDVTGTGHFTGDVTVDGNIAAKYQDVAEWVPATTKMPTGTVVILNSERGNEVMPSNHAYDTTVAGVVSAKPGLILGEASDSKARIATTGRVKVRVDARTHAVKIGDLLVTSDKPGMAMVSQPLDLGGVKIHRPGTLIGKALEPLTGGEGEILVLLSLQ